jgi:UPF0716 family protein affecting phage T7 exclusion
VLGITRAQCLVSIPLFLSFFLSFFLFFPKKKKKIQPCINIKQHCVEKKKKGVLIYTKKNLSKKVHKQEISLFICLFVFTDFLAS